MVEVAILKRVNDDSSVVEIVHKGDIKPNEDEIIVQNTAIGLNSFDAITREQLLEGQLSDNKIVLGYEAVGRIVELGANVRGFKHGDKVVYWKPNAGCCATHCAVQTKYVAAVPQEISEIEALSVFIKGMIAHSLAVRAYIVSDSTKVLVHEVDKPGGIILTQFIKTKKPKLLIGTVSSDDRIEKAKQMTGCNHVLNYNDEDFISEVQTISKSDGVNVLYDSIGSEYILKKSLASLSHFGLLALYNASLFNISNISPIQLAQSSLFLTAMNVFQYKAMREEFIMTAEEIFNMITKGFLRIGVLEYHASQLNSALDAIRDGTTPDCIVAVF